MKTQFTVEKEFIKEAYNSACPDWKAKLKNKFPQAFESELEVGKWYKGYVDFKSLIYITGLEDKKSYTTIKYYGFTFGDYSESGTIANYEHEKSLVPATDKEVETALIAEAKRRGFKEGVFINNSNLGFTDFTQKTTGDKLWWDGTYLNFGDKNWAIFKDGKFAEIISEPIELTLEQIAEKFNVNVEQLKIKK